MPTESTYAIRATRASPPGYANEDKDRRQVYGAALAQFDELIAAARAVGAASRPLPLFYALSQAGRAITAARGEPPWQLRGHGLSAPELSVPILNVKVKRAAKSDGRTTDSITAVAHATDSEVFEKDANIRALWASLPEAFELLPQQSNGVLLPLRLVPVIEATDFTRLDLRQLDRGHGNAILVGFSGTPDELDQHLSVHYPTSTGMRLHRPFPGQPIAKRHTAYGPGLAVRWMLSTDEEYHLQRAQALWRGEALWLRPAVNDVQLSSLLTWWTLLFALSMLARYEPAAWTQAIDYDVSELAAPLRQLLDIGLDRVPELIQRALEARADFG